LTSEEVDGVGLACWGCGYCDAERVDVKTGVTTGNWIEEFGDLDEGDEVLTRGTEQLRPGTELSPK